ncbi:hypothetical protein B296_00047992 [Ensete ventricosum]|uniref:Uncharacterized protein n=1 Tax=Ensete ventricosum TaxID=4639 RepID=A0A426YDB1_ENSVE|nr:hypothetical protein B296_00047992 [Ensete ventricosum]
MVGCLTESRGFSRHLGLGFPARGVHGAEEEGDERGDEDNIEFAFNSRNFSDYVLRIGIMAEGVSEDGSRPPQSEEGRCQEVPRLSVCLLFSTPECYACTVEVVDE